MQDIEPTNLCESCRKELECFQIGIFERENCDDYETMSLDELLERDEFIRAIMVGVCPKCGGEDTYDCENNSLLEDNTIGHCLECETYWCLECGYVFESLEEGMKCPHWNICEQCAEKRGYLDHFEFMETICPKCEYYDAGSCLLDDPLECDKQLLYICPFDSDVSECEEIQEFLRKRM